MVKELTLPPKYLVSSFIMVIVLTKAKSFAQNTIKHWLYWVQIEIALRISMYAVVTIPEVHWKYKNLVLVLENTQWASATFHLSLFNIHVCVFQWQSHMFLIEATNHFGFKIKVWFSYFFYNGRERLG